MKHIFTFLLVLFYFSGLFAQDCTVNISFSANPNIPSGYIFKTDPQVEGAKYYWSFGDNTISDSPMPSHSYKITDTYLVQVKVTKTDGSSCYGTLQERFEAGTGTPTPIVMTGKGKVSKAATTEACGLSITLVGGTVLIPVETVHAFEYKDGQYVEIAYEIHQEIASGCISGISAKIVRISEIVVQPICKVPITISKNSTTPISYTFKTEQQPEGTKFYWSFGDKTSSDMASPTHTFKIADSYLVNLKVSSPEGKICYGEIREHFEGGTVPPSPTILYAKGKVKLTTTTDVCGLLITLNNNTTIVPVEMVPTFVFKDGQYVEIAYELLTDKASGCPNGLAAKIDKISDITPIPVCKVPIAYSKSAATPFSYSFSTDPQPEGSKFYWRFGDGGISELAAPVYTFKKAGLWVINLKVTDAAGKACYGEIKAQFEAGTNPVLSGRGKVRKSTSEGCDLVISTENAVLVPASLVTDFILKDGQYVEFTYEKYAEKITSCKEGTDIKVISIKEIQVVPTCKFEIVIKPKAGSSNSFVFTTVSNSEVKTWKWSFGDGQTSDLKDPEHAYEKAGVYEVSCTITTAAGCTETRTLKHNVLAVPVPDCSGAISIILFDPTDKQCNGKAIVKLLDNQGAEIPNVKYNWSDKQTGSTVENLCPDRNYIVEASVEGVCQKRYSFSFLSKPIWRASSIMGQNNFAVVEPKEGVEYEWDFGNGTVLKGAEVTYNFANDGVYDVQLKAAIGTDFTTYSQEIVVMNSITGTTIINKSEINIFPNPAKDMLKINFGTPVKGDICLEILNLAGQKQLTRRINTDGFSQAAINIEQLKSGMYFLRISSGDKVIIDHKFLKTN
jgi:PKD repeat protein